MSDAAARQKVLVVIAVIVGLVAIALIAYNLNRFLNPPAGVVGGVSADAEAGAEVEAPTGDEPGVRRGGPMVAPN